MNRTIVATQDAEKLKITISLVNPELTDDDLHSRIDHITDDTYQHAVLPRFWSRTIKVTE